MKVERSRRKLGVGEGISVRVRGWDGLQWPAALAVVGGGRSRVATQGGGGAASWVVEVNRWVGLVAGVNGSSG